MPYASAFLASRAALTDAFSPPSVSPPVSRQISIGSGPAGKIRGNAQLLWPGRFGPSRKIRRKRPRGAPDGPGYGV
jgi:hypothetical protein